MSTGRDGDLIRRIEHLEERDQLLQELLDLKNMGRGALWITLKIGAVVATIVGIVIAAWRFLHGGS